MKIATLTIPAAGSKLPKPPPPHELKRILWAISSPLYLFAAFIGVFIITMSASHALQRVTVDQRDKALTAASKVSDYFDQLKGGSFIEVKKAYWRKDFTKNSQKVSVIVYRQSNKHTVNVALIAPSVKLGNLFEAVNKGAFANFQLKHVTMFLISPNNPLDEAQGGTPLSELPSPIRHSLTNAVPGMKSVNLPSGLFVIDQFQASNNKTVKEVFDIVGISFPVVSSMRLNGSNYKNLFKGRGNVGLSLAIHMTRNNPLARLVDKARVLTSPKDAAPVLTLSAQTKSDKLSISYDAPYMAFGKGPFDTSLAFTRNKAGKTFSLELSLDVGTIANPVIVPGLLELNGFQMEDTTLTLGLEIEGAEGEASVGLEIGKMKVDGITYEPVRMQLAFNQEGPSGGLFEMETKQTISLEKVGLLAQRAFQANPDSKIIPDWAKNKIWDKLKLGELPAIGIKAPHIYLATPGQDEASHLADLHDIGGAGVKLRGGIEFFGREVAKADLGLDAASGLHALGEIVQFKTGPLELKDASMDIMAKYGVGVHLKLHTDLSLYDTRIHESEISIDRWGMKYVDDVGCKPPMTRVEFQTRGWKFSSGGIGPSDCARRMADAIAEATRRAAEQAAAAAEAAVDAARKTGEEIGRFSQKTFKVIEGIFKPERETRPAQVRPAFRITQEMENYRKLEGPAHCWNNSFWHQGYRTCMPLTGYSARQEMVLYVFDGSKKARCLTIQGNKNKNGQKLVLWDCIGKWSQQFRITPWDRKSKTTGKVRIINDAGKCVAADVSKKKAMFARIVLRNCSRGEGQRWIFRGGQLIGARNLCLRTKGRNVNGGSLTLRTCSADENPKEIEKEILSLREGIKQQTERRNHLQATPPPPPPGPKGFRDTKRYARDLEKYKRSRKNRTVEIAAIDKKLPGFMKKLEQLEHDNKKSNSSEPPVEWVRGPSMSSPGEAFAKKFKIAGSRSLRLKTGTGCVDNGDVYYRALTPYGVKPCNGKGQPINIGVVEKEYFTLVSKLSFHCLSVYGSLKADGTKIVSWPCLNTANQLWRAARPVSGDLKLANKSNKGVFKKNFMLVSRQSGKCLTALDGVGFDNAMKKYRRLYKNRVARAAYMARHKRDMPTPEAHSKKIFKSYWVSNSNSQFILGSCDARSQGQQFRLG